MSAVDVREYRKRVNKLARSNGAQARAIVDLEEQIIELTDQFNNLVKLVKNGGVKNADTKTSKASTPKAATAKQGPSKASAASDKIK